MDATDTPGFIACSRMSDTITMAQTVNALFKSSGYVVTAKVSDTQFRRLSEVDLHKELPAWDEGRIFSPIAELRWRYMATGGFATLLLTENEQHIPTTWERLGKSWSVVIHDSDDKRLQLWGKRKVDSPYWIEVRIPRMLVYPSEKTEGAVRVTWIEYRDPQGAPRFTRLKEVE